MLSTKVIDASDQGQDRAQAGIAAAGVAHDFPLNSVFLVGECQGHEGSLLEFGSRGGGQGNAMMWSNEELDILESEWVSIVGVRASSVLAWA
jgi:hypothetical protein